MPNFSNKSRKLLSTCHPDLQAIMNEAIKQYDFSILEGARSTERQIQLFKEGKSKCDGIKIKSNHQPRTCKECPQGCSFAIDIAPFPIDWEDTNAFKELAVIVLDIANEMYNLGEIKHKLRWGGDWNMNGKTSDETFRDYPHFELIGA